MCLGKECFNLNRLYAFFIINSMLLFMLYLFSAREKFTFQEAITRNTQVEIG